MTTKLQTNIEFVQEIALALGVELSDAEADMILWEHTGFPCFFDGYPPLVIQRQVTEYLAGRATE